mmetsp:Transcript_9148/g.19313  ORF Transcript_9148/g.19313 Transcript_9148/m.19313 type:complete len:343 (+) Transcript_9148:511-1539(+)
MRNDNSSDAAPRSSLSNQIVNRRLHNLLALIVQRRCRLIQNEHRRFANQGSCNSDALLLTTAQFAPTCPHLGLKFVREGLDEGIGVGRFRRSFNLLHSGVIWPRFAPCDILGNGVVEQQRLLRHDTNMIPHRPNVKITYIHAIDTYPALLWIIEPTDQSSNGRLSTSRFAHEGHGLSRCNFEVDVVKYFGRAGGVLEVQALDRNSTFHGGHHFSTSAWRRINVRVSINNLVQLPRGQLSFANALERRRDHREHKPRNHYTEKNSHGPSRTDTVRGEIEPSLSRGTATLDDNNVVAGEAHRASINGPVNIGCVEGLSNRRPGNSTDTCIEGFISVKDVIPLAK